MAHRGLSHLQPVRPECRADGRGVSRDSVAPTSRVSRYGAARLLDMNGFKRQERPEMICAQSGSPSTSEHQPGIVQPSHTFKPFDPSRSEEHTSELQSLMRISYAVFCLKKKKEQKTQRV